jgi:hypothetical protein
MHTRGEQRRRPRRDILWGAATSRGGACDWEWLGVAA